MSFRVLPPFIQFLKNDGSLNSGGTVTTYLTDLTTLAPTYTDPDLTTSNGSTVDLDAYGRPEVDMWSDVLMGVEVKDALGVTVSTLNNVPGYGGEDQELPTDGDPGDFLQWDGAGYILAPILSVPDPSGLNGYYLGSDGTGTPVWIQFPETPEPVDPEIVVGAESFQAGVSDDETKFLIQRGTGSAPATGTVNTSLAVVFDTEYDDTPTVHVTPTSDSNSGGPMVPEISALSSTGFTVLLTIAAGDLDNAKVLNAVPFNWTAFGNVEVPAE